MRKYFGLLAATGLATVPVLSMAAAPTLSDVLGASGISAAGHLSGGYTAGFNKGQTLAGHTFDYDSNTFALNQADLTLSSLPASGFGGAVELMAGNDAKVINAALGSGSSDFTLPSAYLQYATGNLTVIGGRYWTLAGAEVADDSKNTNISRSFLYQLAETFTHTGVRASYKLSDSMTGYLGVANSAFTGTTNLDGDKTKTLESGFAWAPTSSSSYAVYDYYGVQSFEFSGTETRVNYLDGVASFPIVGNLAMVLNFDWAQFVPVNSTTGTFGIYGGAGYLNYQFNDSWKASLRGEYLKAHGGYLGDPNGDGSGKAKISEVTLTADYSAAKNFDLLAEVRFDMGDKIYPDPGTAADGSDFASQQGEVELKAIYKFGTT